VHRVFGIFILYALVDIGSLSGWAPLHLTRSADKSSSRGRHIFGLGLAIVILANGKLNGPTLTLSRGRISNSGIYGFWGGKEQVSKGEYLR